MKFNRLIAITLVLVVFGSLIFVGATGSNDPNQISSETSQADTQLPQGFSPMAIAITQDGKHAYLSFDLSEVIFKVKLSDLTVESTVNLPNYFPIECEKMVLDASEAKLFAYTPSWQKLIVIDTQTMSVIHTIENISVADLTRSQYGHYLIAPSGGGTVYFVNTDTYEVTQFTDNNVFFVEIEESSSSQNSWYVVSHPPPWNTTTVGIYDYKTKTWNYSVTISKHSQSESISNLEVLPNEQKVYLSAYGGSDPKGYGYGWFYSIDFTGAEGLKVIPIDGGSGCLESSPDNKWLYVGTGWPIQNDKNLLVVDTQSDNIVGQIYLGKTSYGWAFTQMNNLQIDPSHPNLLYATCSDSNAFIKVNLDSLTLNATLILNQESFKPRFFVKQPMQDTGYILIEQSAGAFRFDIENETMNNMVEFPNIRSNSGAYDIAIDDNGRMFIAQGERILEVDAKNMQLIGTRQLPSGISGLWHFILANDQTKLYSIWQDPTQGTGYHPDTFLAIKTSTFQVEARIKLEGGNFEYKPFELPNESKIYALGGMQNGPVVIHVIDKNNYNIQKTITFDEPGLLGIAAGPNYPFSYDSSSHTLFVGARQVVLGIDTDTDTIKKIIYLGDSARAIGLEPNQLTFLNAVGLVYNPHENLLYIAHVDRSFVSIYNLTNNQFLPKAIPLKGYFPMYTFANDDFSKIYCLMGRSDSVSVIDVKSKTLEKVIDLHSSLPAATTIFSFQGFTKTYDVVVSSNSSVSLINFNIASKQISFRAMGSSFGFSFPFFYNVSFPNELLGGAFTVQIDGNPTTAFTRKDNGTHTSLFFIYELQGAKNFQVTGTETVAPTPTQTPSPTTVVTPTSTPTHTLKPTSVPASTPSTIPTLNPTPTPSIPEVQSWIILPALFAILALSTILIKKKR